MHDVTLSDIEAFLKKEGKHGERVLATLGKNSQFLNAISTPLGQELLKDSVARLEVLLEKIVNEQAEPKELAEYRVLRDLIYTWAERITKYVADLNKIKGGK